MATGRQYFKSATELPRGRPVDPLSERQARLHRIRDRAIQLGKVSKLQQEPEILGDRDLRTPQQRKQEQLQLSMIALKERRAERDAEKLRLDLRPRESLHRTYWDGDRYVDFEVTWDGR